MSRPGLDPQGKHALFGAPPQAPPDHLRSGRTSEGRHALYSTGPHQSGTVLVECGSCGERHRTTLVQLGLRMLPFNVWLPGRSFPHYMRCPHCKHRSWCKIGWGA